jgi:2-C-methyl-D-erythritol 2,4-cyclodiphosphate synthase
MSVGIGYDSHRFAEGRRLVLGGVEVDHPRGLAGHSDADVLTHAVIDALLGAAGKGDIGTLFPDDDEAWRDADSIDLLRTAVGSIAGRIVNVDATLICEEPRIGPWRAEMERVLAEATSASAGPANDVLSSNRSVPIRLAATTASMKPRWLRHMIPTPSPGPIPRPAKA